MEISMNLPPRKITKMTDTERKVFIFLLQPSHHLNFSSVPKDFTSLLDTNWNSNLIQLILTCKTFELTSVKQEYLSNFASSQHHFESQSRLCAIDWMRLVLLTLEVTEMPTWRGVFLFSVNLFLPVFWYATTLIQCSKQMSQTASVKALCLFQSGSDLIILHSLRTCSVSCSFVNTLFVHKFSEKNKTKVDST